MSHFTALAVSIVMLGSGKPSRRMTRVAVEFAHSSFGFENRFGVSYGALEGKSPKGCIRNRYSESCSFSVGILFSCNDMA